MKLTEFSFQNSFDHLFNRPFVKPLVHEDNVKDLILLGKELKHRHYNFTTVTPETHRRFLEQKIPLSKEHALRDFLGWNHEVPEEFFPSSLLDLFRAAKLIIEGSKPGFIRSLLRASTLDNKLFWHSAYPTNQSNSVFFGPDSYRFVRFLKDNIKVAKHILDLGCGTGVGGLLLANRANKITLTDINESALILAKANCAMNGFTNVTILKSNFLSGVPKGADWVIANPPFIMDEGKRSYRDGGKNFGSELSLQMIECAMKYLNPGGHLAMYTGACVINGEDQVLKGLRKILDPSIRFSYEELDPDIFGEELSSPRFLNVERIAAVGIVIKR